MIQILSRAVAAWAVAGCASFALAQAGGQAEEKPALPAIKENDAQGVASPLDLQPRQQQFARRHDGAFIWTTSGSSQIYGKAFGGGATPQAAAQTFVDIDMPLL